MRHLSERSLRLCNHVRITPMAWWVQSELVVGPHLVALRLCLPSVHHNESLNLCYPAGVQDLEGLAGGSACGDLDRLLWEGRRGASWSICCFMFCDLTTAWSC